MQPLNPFLRALFSSTVVGQAIPIHNHVLLVPCTETLLQTIDRESGRPYIDLVRDEEFLGSHILRVDAQHKTGGKDGTSVRDSRGKAKSYTTLNGRTVIIKEHMVYSNKGFKTLSQAQLLTDAIYFAAHDAQNWLIYYISKPLIGTLEGLPIVPAIKHKQGVKGETVVGSSLGLSVPKKKDVRSFSDLLNNFPMIARQMHPGLDRLFTEFSKELGKPLPLPPSASSSSNYVSHDDAGHGVPNGSIKSSTSKDQPKLPNHPCQFQEDEENLMRRALETAVTAAIDLFQGVDKQQLSFLGATTELTGPVVERLIERYIAEQVHDNLLFPRICSFHRGEDHELDRRIRQMENIDVSQVGIAIDGGKAEKESFTRRLNKGVENFRRIGVACSPQEMLAVLLATEKAVTAENGSDGGSDQNGSEKTNSVMTVNADVLVSLLLVVVIRSQIRHLHARLSYMQKFIFIDDVESGEVGYALSTFEAVLSYLMKDAGGLRKASGRNKRLWTATKTGDLDDMKAILELDDMAHDEKLEADLHETSDDSHMIRDLEDLSLAGPGGSLALSRSSSNASTKVSSSMGTNLAHVFPFQLSDGDSSRSIPTKLGKRVSMDVRSLSSVSIHSFKSRTTTLGSMASGIEGDLSVHSLSKTQDSLGNSIPMMATESRQPESLRYLLSLDEYYPLSMIVEDTSNEGTTLLSAAIQLGHIEIIDIVLDKILQLREEHDICDYLAKSDSRGRTAAHYLFSAPQLLSKLQTKIPWTKKDRVGQTPLFAICRSYDHPNYGNMVSEALTVATSAQGDGLPLRLADHTDSKGNSLLHIVNDPAIIRRILHHCDVDPNATNDKKFTPLMLASKYGRIDMVRVFFADARIDLNMKELRGLTAVELAKDDEIRNKIDDLTLFSDLSVTPPSKASGRVTAVVRTFIVEDGSTRFVLKSGAPLDASRPHNTFTITTSRRTLGDFHNLARWLALEHPASYLPNIPSFRNPLQVISKPSRAVLHDMQNSLDRFLKTLLAHPTFGTHEMLWEFLLVPDMQSEQMAQRANLKAQLLAETIQDEYEPVSDVQEVEQNIAHSQRMILSLGSRTRRLLLRTHTLQQSHDDLAGSLHLLASGMMTLGFPADALPDRYCAAMAQYARLMTTPADSSPLKGFIEDCTGFNATMSALQTSFMRPTILISQLASHRRAISRNENSLNSHSLPRKFNFPGMEDSRQRTLKDAEAKIVRAHGQVEKIARELRWTTEVVVGELAGWTAWREQVGRESVRRYVKGMVVKEKERAKGLDRCLRELKKGKG